MHVLLTVETNLPSDPWRIWGHHTYSLARRALCRSQRACGLRRVGAWSWPPAAPSAGRWLVGLHDVRPARAGRGWHGDRPRDQEVKLRRFEYPVP
jgi:hypothetical protein